MLSLPPSVRVFVAVQPIDMRGSFDALAGAVRRLELDPVDGHLYLFLNKRRRIAKALWFDGSGWCLLAKRLEAGSFQLPAVDAAQADQAAFSIGRLGHGAGAGGVGRDAQLAERRALRDGEVAVLDRERQVAAQDLARLAGQALAKSLGRRAGGGDGRDPQRQAGQEDTEAAHARAQLAGGQAEGEGGLGHAAIRPSAIRTMRSARLARAGS